MVLGDAARWSPRSADTKPLAALGCVAMSECAELDGLIHGMREETPNDPKLSDGGAWRGSCERRAQNEATDVGQSHERTRRARARIAATVTRGAVRCSAWLGVTWLRRGRCERVRNTLGLARDSRTSCRPWSGAGEKHGTRLGGRRIGWMLTNNGREACRCVPGTGARCGNENGVTQNKSSKSEQTSERLCSRGDVR